jgi:signal transduction histidine kinase
MAPTLTESWRAGAWRLAPSRLGFLSRFNLASLAILLAGMLVIGSWMAHRIEAEVIERSAQLSSTYAQLLMAPHVAELSAGGRLSDSVRAELDRHFRDPRLQSSIPLARIWSPQGDILYSAHRERARGPAPGQGFAHALDGQVQGRIRSSHAAGGQRMMQVFAPLGTDTKVWAVLELGIGVDGLEASVRSAQQQSWGLAMAGTGLMYLLLLGMARQASRTMGRQRDELAQNVVQLQDLLAQNRRMRERIRRAGARTTALNEQYLHRLSADLHDGPGQDLALALLRLDELYGECRGCETVPRQGGSVDEDFETIVFALHSALKEVRTCCAELRLPGFERLSLNDVVARVVREFERKTRQSVAVTTEGELGEAPLSVKIALYRVIQEALANGFRHASGAAQRVHVAATDADVIVEISDEGPGMATLDISTGTNRLGMRGMRERVELLGGDFEIRSVVGEGTTIHARLPRTFTDIQDDE